MLGPAYQWQLVDKLEISINYVDFQMFSKDLAFATIPFATFVSRNLDFMCLTAVHLLLTRNNMD